HGPIAAVTRGVPVVALCAAGPAQADVDSLIDELRARQATVLTVGDGAHADIRLPRAAPDPLMPIVAVVRGQQLAYALAMTLGLDPDSPAGLTKITAT